MLDLANRRSRTLIMVLLTGSHRLDNGLLVRVRFPHRRDRAAVADFHRRIGVPCEELDLQRLLSFDLRRRRTVVAVAWADRVETLVGIATTTHDGDPTPDALVADETLAPGVSALLLAALAEQERARVA